MNIFLKDCKEKMIELLNKDYGDGYIRRLTKTFKRPFSMDDLLDNLNNSIEDSMYFDTNTGNVHIGDSIYLSYERYLNEKNVTNEMTPELVSEKVFLEVIMDMTYMKSSKEYIEV